MVVSNTELFIHMVSNLDTDIPDVIYMDDTTLIEVDKKQSASNIQHATVGGTLDVIEQKLKPDICNVVTWCDDNRMAIKYDNTKAILITTCQKLHTLPVKELNITVKGKVLENEKQENYLA